jgi:hypothetical protein
MGGMAAQIPIKDNKAANDAALAKVRIICAVQLVLNEAHTSGQRLSPVCLNGLHNMLLHMMKYPVSRILFYHITSVICIAGWGRGLFTACIWHTVD